MRIGIGYDTHKLVEGRKLILGGLDIPHYKGLLGHSDADVLLHAIMDSILGACALGDIGKHFPDTDLKYKDISSIFLLKKVCDLIYENGYKIINLDSVIIAEKPKLLTYIPEMISNISLNLNLEKSCINIKATTNEGLGFVGREEGITAQAVVIVESF